MSAIRAEESRETQYSSIAARGVWHRPNASGRENTLQGLCSVLDEMKECGINMVFLETFYHGMTVFKTNLAPYYTGFDQYDFGSYPDYLTAFTAEAKKRDIEVHAWVESFYIGINESASLVKFFPSWLLVNEHGQIRHTTEGADLGGYIFFDPANPSARGYLLRLYKEILTKAPDIKGLNLDYIRYPVSDFSAGTDSGYTDVAMSAFAEKYNLTVNEENKIQNFKAQIKANSLVSEWTAYRAEQVTSFIKEVSETVNEKYQDCIISVAIHPDITKAYNQKKQDFISWVKNGYIDVVTPMVYHYAADQISSALSDMLAKFEGVYCYTGLYTTYHNQSTSELEKHIGASERCGADGFVLFDSAKTFFTPAHNYSEFLSNKYGTVKPSALPHWATDRLIHASTSIIADKLTANSESPAAVNAFMSEMQEISLIGEQSIESLDKTLYELAQFKEHTAASAQTTLDLLIDLLEVRKSRLSFKGCPERLEPPSDSEDEESSSDSSLEKDEESSSDSSLEPDEESSSDSSLEPDEESSSADGNDTHNPPLEEPTEPTSFLNLVMRFFQNIINWFKKLFA
ncbi:MAG: family 10 glycosylhydrolase [Clostridia bacterium]|nr:family 10 glycosylhydrolase [Clostridia bacterium]